MAKYKVNSLTQFTANVRRAVNAGLQSSAKVVQNNAKATIKRRGGKYVPSAPGTPPNSQSSALRNSIVSSLDRNTLRSSIGSKLPYGVALELGWIIEPRKVRRLPVPVNEAAKRLNASRGTTSLKSYPMTFINRGHKNPLLIGVDKTKSMQYVTDAKGVRKEKHAKNVPVYVLVEKVFLKARPYMEPAFRKSKPELSKAFFFSANAIGKPLGLNFVSIPR